MTRHEVVSYTVTCDVCGDEISEDHSEGASQKISWEGTDYVVDMCGRDQEALGAVLSQLKVFVDAGQERAATARRGTSMATAKVRSKASQVRRASGSKSRSGAGSGPSNMLVVRAWALENGYQVGHRGRIPAGVLAAYDQARASTRATPAPKKRRSREVAAASA